MPRDQVGPVAMERIGREPNSLERVRRDGDACWRWPRVESRSDAESLLGGRVRDQIHHDFMADERPAAPVLGDVAEHPMLDLVPFAGPRRKVAHGDAQPGVVGEPLQRYLPQAAVMSKSLAVGYLLRPIFRHHCWMDWTANSGVS